KIAPRPTRRDPRTQPKNDRDCTHHQGSVLKNGEGTSWRLDLFGLPFFPAAPADLELDGQDIILPCERRGRARSSPGSRGSKSRGSHYTARRLPESVPQVLAACSRKSFFAFPDPVELGLSKCKFGSSIERIGFGIQDSGTVLLVKTVPGFGI